MADWVGAVRAGFTKMHRRLHTAVHEVKLSRTETWAQEPKLVELGQILECLACDKAFDSPQALSVHLFSVHSIGRPFRQLVDHRTHCMQCMNDFHTRPRVIQHLMQGSERCAYLYRTTMPVLTPRAVAALDKIDAEDAGKLKRRGHTRVHMDTRMSRIPGPLTAEAHLMGIDHQFLLQTGRKGKRLRDGMDKVTEHIGYPIPAPPG